jgi:hypothetical protein
MAADPFDPDRHQQILERFLAKACDQLRENIRTKKATRRNGPVNASGNLAKSIRYELAEDVGTIYAAGYAFAVEFGRGPGKMPPVKSIRAWIDAKGIEPTGISKDSLAFLIARKIAREGTDIYKEGGKSGILSGVVNAQAMEALRTELFGVLAADITSFLLKEAIS